jgi:hypothetical protein
MSVFKKAFEVIKSKFKNPPTFLEKDIKQSNTKFENDLLQLLLTRTPSRRLTMASNAFLQKECHVKAVGLKNFEVKFFDRKHSQRKEHFVMPRTPLGSGANYIPIAMLEVLKKLHLSQEVSSGFLAPYAFEFEINDETENRQTFHNYRSLYGIQHLLSFCVLVLFPLYASVPIIALQHNWYKQYMKRLKNNSHTTILMDDAVLLSFHIWATYYCNRHEPSTELLAYLAYLLANDPQCSAGALYALNAEELEKLYKRKFQEALELRANSALIMSKNFIRANHDSSQDHGGRSLRATSLQDILGAQDNIPLAFKIIRDTNQIEAFLAYLNEPKCYSVYEIEDDFIARHTAQAQAFLHHNEAKPQHTSIIVPHSATGSLSELTSPSTTIVIEGASGSFRD